MMKQAYDLQTVHNTI